MDLRNPEALEQIEMASGKVWEASSQGQQEFLGMGA